MWSTRITGIDTETGHLEFHAQVSPPSYERGKENHLSYNRLRDGSLKPPEACMEYAFSVKGT